MLPTCWRHVVPTQDVAPILARWVRVADTRFKMLGPFVSATADTNFSCQNPSAYVETYVWYVSYICTLKLETLVFLLRERWHHRVSRRSGGGGRWDSEQTQGIYRWILHRVGNGNGQGQIMLLWGEPMLLNGWWGRATADASTNTTQNWQCQKKRTTDRNPLTNNRNSIFSMV